MTMRADTALVNMLTLRRSRAGGAETYATRLVPSLAEAWAGDLVVLVREDSRSWLEGRGWSPEWMVPVAPVGSGPLSVPLTGVRAARKVAAAEATVLSPFNIHTPGARRDREVIAIQDLISFHYLDGRWGSTERPIELRAKARLLARSVSRAAAVVVHLEATREELLRWVPDADPARVHVVPLGAGIARTSTPVPVTDEAYEQSGRPFALVVGSSDLPHKNLDVVFRAARTETFRATGAEVVLVGRTVPDIPAELSDTVRAVVDAPDEVVARLYRECACLIVPSWIEGFGLPLLEGLTLGAPCVASDIPAFRETGDTAPLFFDPASEEDLAQAIVRALTDTQWSSEARRAGPVRAAEFTWVKSAAGYADVMRAVAQASR